MPKQTDTHFSSQQENVYSFNYQQENASYACDSSNEQESVEPFNNEKEAMDFVNYYAQKVINCEWSCKNQLCYDR